MAVVRGGQEALQEAIEDRSRSGPSAGFAAPLVSKNQKKSGAPAAGPRQAEVSQAVLIPAGSPAAPETPPASAETEPTEYEKSLELSPPLRFSRNLSRNDSFEDALAQSTLPEVRDGYEVDEDEVYTAERVYHE